MTNSQYIIPGDTCLPLLHMTANYAPPTVHFYDNEPQHSVLIIGSLVKLYCIVCGHLTDIAALQEGPAQGRGPSVTTLWPSTATPTSPPGSS